MWKAFSILEKGLIFFSILGLAFKLLIWKGGDFLLMISLALLSVVYFLGSYFQRGISSRQTEHATILATTVLLKIFSGIAFSTITIALLFKLLFWNGSFAMLVAGIATTAGILLWSLVASKSLTKPLETAVFRRSAISLSLGVAALLIRSSTIYSVFHRDDPQLVQKWIRMSEQPRNPAYKAEFDAYRRQQYPASN